MLALCETNLKGNEGFVWEGKNCICFDIDSLGRSKKWGAILITEKG